MVKSSLSFRARFSIAALIVTVSEIKNFSDSAPPRALPENEIFFSRLQLKLTLRHYFPVSAPFCKTVEDIFKNGSENKEAQRN
jgi:hypothetical protein